MSTTPRLDDLEDEYGIDARRAVEDWSGELYVVTFQQNLRGGDPVAHTFDGKTVFPDKYRGGDQIAIGEPWICDVTSKGGSTFFAAPLVRIDPTFFFELMPEQMERLAEVAVRLHGEELQGVLKAALAKTGNVVAGQQLEVLEKENAALEQKVSELQARLTEALSRVAHAEAAAVSQEAATAVGTERSRPAEPFIALGGVHEAGPIHVVRTAEDVLESQAFTADHYYGHVSPDGQRLFLKAHPKGNLTCTGGRLFVPGLNRIVVFEEATTLSGNYDPRHGGFFVRL